MTEPVPVEELRAREDAEFPVKPGTNEEDALRFLAANPDFGWPPKTIADRTEIPESSATKTAARLYEKGLVDRSAGYYFVVPERLDEIQGFLGDLHHLVELAGEPGQDPVHPTGPTERERAEPEPSSTSEVDELVDEVADASPTGSSR